jgi:hypothetical protein
MNIYLVFALAIKGELIEGFAGGHFVDSKPLRGGLQ